MLEKASPAVQLIEIQPPKGASARTGMNQRQAWPQRWPLMAVASNVKSWHSLIPKGKAWVPLLHLFDIECSCDVCVTITAKTKTKTSRIGDMYVSVFTYVYVQAWSSMPVCKHSMSTLWLVHLALWQCTTQSTNKLHGKGQIQKETHQWQTNWKGSWAAPVGGKHPKNLLNKRGMAA